MPRRQKTFHYIYKTTCLVTGKFYVGMHSTDDLEDGYLGSGKILGYSLAKHGRENHKRDIIEMCPSREALKLREKEIVNEELLADPLNINLKYGGDGGWASSSAVKGNKSPRRDLASIQRKIVCTLAERKQPRFGGNHGYHGVRPDWTGKKHRGETKAKIGAANSVHQSGTGNSQYGTCWVTNGMAVKIKKQDLDSYLSNGYIQGRTMQRVV